MTYNKTLNPPEGIVYMETPCGLKYWKDPEPGNDGLATEDASISIQSYTGGGHRNTFNNYMLHYKGYQGGFVNRGFDSEGFPRGNIPDEKINEGNKIYRTGYICGLGTPVFDYYGRLSEHDVYDRSVSYEKRNPYWTNLSYEEYAQGERIRFDSKQQQDEVVALLPILFAGFKLNLRRLQNEQDRRSTPYINFLTVKFTESVLKEIESGVLIHAA